MLRLVSLTALALLAACASTSSGGQNADRTKTTAELGTPASQAVPPDPVPASPAEPESALPPAPASAWDFYHERYDADGDGRITRAEYTRTDKGFERVDANDDGVVSAEDFGLRWDDVPREDPGLMFDYGRGGPRFGTPAPAFKLRSTTGEEIELAQFRGVKPVVLVFGSFT